MPLISVLNHISFRLCNNLTSFFFQSSLYTSAIFLKYRFTHDICLLILLQWFPITLRTKSKLLKNSTIFWPFQITQFIWHSFLLILNSHCFKQPKILMFIYLIYSHAIFFAWAIFHIPTCPLAHSRYTLNMHWKILVIYYT